MFHSAVTGVGTKIRQTVTRVGEMVPDQIRGTCADLGRLATLNWHETSTPFRRRMAISAFLVAIFATPAAAQSSSSVSLCDQKFIEQVIQAAYTLIVYGAATGMILTYAATSLGESLPTIGQQEEERLKNMRGKALSSGFKVVMIGPIAAILKSATSIPLMQCVDLVPFV